MADLRLALLGPLHIQHGRLGAVTLPNRKAIALLTYLALEADQPHSRASLVGLLWPDLPDTDARNNLRVTWSYLRQRLGADPALANPLLMGSRLDLHLNPHGYSLDVIEFQALIEACQVHAHDSRSRCPDCEGRLAQAAGLYRGEFLAGFHLEGCPTFDEWLFVLREQLHIQVMDALDDLTQYHERQGEYKTAERYARRQIELDALREGAHRQLMRLLDKQGQRAVALAQYEVCRRVLAEELGVEPEAETVWLYQHLKSHHVAEAAPHSMSAQPNGRAAAPADTRRQDETRVGSAHNLPDAVTPFIGREEELAQMGERLREGSYRLLSIVGPGGSGKTRLTVQAARENQHLYADGVTFVPLASVQRLEEAPTAIAAALGIELIDAQSSPWQQVLAALRPKHMLLVLDNLEHLLGDKGDAVTAGEALLDLVRQAPGVYLIITSRESLHLQAEDLFLLGGLPVPRAATLAEAGRFAAVRLLCDRAYRLDKSFKLTEQNLASVVRICTLVDGLPLAIELATAWITTFELADLATAIERNLDTLTTTYGDVAPPHRSMRAVFDHSWRLLTPGEQAVLRQLTVFRGGFSLAAAAAVAGATPLTLSRLRYKSLITTSGGRYGMHELLRQFAAEKVREAGEAAAAHSRHLHYFLELTLREEDKRLGGTSKEWVQTLDAEHDNVRAALDWASVADPEAGLRLAGELGWPDHFWPVRGYFSEGRQWLRRLLTQRVGASAAAQARALVAAGTLAEAQADYAEQAALLTEGLSLYRAMGDARGCADALSILGYSYMVQGDLARARAAYAECLDLSELASYSWGIGVALNGLGKISMGEGDFAVARTLFERCVTLGREVNDMPTVIRSLGNLAVIAYELEDFDTAKAVEQEVVRYERERQHQRALAIALNNLGLTVLRQGDYAAARAYFEEGLLIRCELKVPLGFAYSLENFGHLATALGEAERAAQLHGASDAIRESLGAVLPTAHGNDTKRDLATIQAVLGEARFAAAWEAGQALTLDQAIALALGASDSPPVSTSARLDASPASRSSS